jgi:hypothetical protein
LDPLFFPQALDQESRVAADAHSPHDRNRLVDIPDACMGLERSVKEIIVRRYLVVGPVARQFLVEPSVNEASLVTDGVAKAIPAREADRSHLNDSPVWMAEADCETTDVEAFAPEIFRNGLKHFRRDQCIIGMNDDDVSAA